jgi:hypothetical protein
MRLSKLQQKLFDTMIANDDFDLILAELENADEYIEQVRHDISTMDAIELRANIKVWEE